MHIRRLRKALTQDGETEIIRTVRGVGIEKDQVVAIKDLVAGTAIFERRPS